MPEKCGVRWRRHIREERAKPLEIVSPLRALGKGFENFGKIDGLCKGFAPRIQLQAPKKSIPLSVLFGGKVRRPERITQVDEEAALMEALAEQIEDGWLDDGAIEQEGDEYEP
ncbi:hypothetical protein BJV74DRAFT_795003 [Russula compacta]|nr:hypothetical protein BJV74DRAFT_795003 [Russula compacta]